MSFKPPFGRITSFWIYQLLGWGIYYIASLFHVFFSRIYSTQKFFGEFIQMIIGLGLTTLMRYYYKKITFSSQSVFHLLRKIIIVSFIGAIIWYYLISISKLLMFESGMMQVGASITVIIGWIFILFPIIFSWSSLYFGIKFWLEWDYQRNKANEANLLAKKTQLQLLRYQMNPHFLFNALNSIRALIGQKDENAKAMVTELSEFLRYSLISKDNNEAPLKEEINAIKHYLSIEKKRYEEKLNTIFEIDSSVEDFRIVSYLLHPLVENAVKFGMKTSEMPLEVKISVRDEENYVGISIINTGKWFNHTEENSDSYSGTGTGLQNVKSRLASEYPDRHEFQTLEKDGKVFVVLKIFKN